MALPPKLQKIYEDRYCRTNKVSPNTIDNDARVKAGELMINFGKFQEALDLLNSQDNIELDPFALNTRGRAKTALKQYSDAEEDLGAAERLLKYALSMVNVNKSLNAIESKQFTKAFQFAETACEFDSQWAAPWVNKICACLLMNNIEGAWDVIENMKQEWPLSQNNEEIIWHFENDGVISILRNDPCFNERIQQYVEIEQ